MHLARRLDLAALPPAHLARRLDLAALPPVCLARRLDLVVLPAHREAHLDRPLDPAVLLEGGPLLPARPLQEPALHHQHQAVLPRPDQEALRDPDLPHQP